MDKQVALITGCSSGIGRALAQAFRHQGFVVVATARRAADVSALRRDGWDAVALDVTRSDSIAAVAAHIGREFGRLDVLVNNAGYGQFGALLDLEPDDLRRQFETNVFAPLALVRVMLPFLRAAGDARIVNIGSVSGILTTPFAGAYCASKAALHALSDAMRMELAPFGLHVVTVQPGAIASRMGENGAAQVVLPPNSLYQKIACHVHQRAVLSQQGASPAQQFARQLVAAVLKKRPVSVLRLGSNSHRIPFLRRWLPLKMLDNTLIKRFGLNLLP